MTTSIVPGPEIKVGVSVSLSGKYHFHGRQALDGILLFSTYANAQGGILLGDRRRSVRLVWYDDDSRASRTRENVLRLIRSDQVDILLGPYSSALTMAAAEVAGECKKVLWNYGGTSDQIFSRGWHHLVGVASPASDYLRGLPHWLAREDSELRRISVLYAAQGSFASQVAAGIVESARDTGHRVDLVPFDMPFTKNDSSFFEKFLALQPQAVVLAASFEDELLVLETRPRWPRTVRFIAAVAAGTAAFGPRVGLLADQVVGPSQWEPGVRFPDLLGPASDWFADRFQKQFRLPPDYVAAGSFASGLIVAECIQRANSLEDQKLRGMASTLECNTFYGRFSIEAESGRQRGHQILLIRWQNGRKLLLRPS